MELTGVRADGLPYHDFDAEELTVRLPAGDEPVRVRVEPAPARMRLCMPAKAGLDADFVIVGCALPDVADALLATDAFLLEGGDACVHD